MRWHNCPLSTPPTLVTEIVSFLQRKTPTQTRCNHTIVHTASLYCTNTSANSRTRLGQWYDALPLSACHRFKIPDAPGNSSLQANNLRADLHWKWQVTLNVAWMFTALKSKQHLVILMPTCKCSSTPRTNTILQGHRRYILGLAPPKTNVIGLQKCNGFSTNTRVIMGAALRRKVWLSDTTGFELWVRGQGVKLKFSCQ